MTNETVLTESPKLYLPTRPNRHGLLSPFMTGMKICPPLQACGRVRKVNRIMVTIMGVFWTCVLRKINYIHPSLSLSWAALLLPFQKLNWGIGMGIQVPSRHSGLRRYAGINKGRESHYRVSGWRGTSRVRRLEQGYGSAVDGGLTHSISCTIGLCFCSPEGCFPPSVFFLSYTRDYGNDSVIGLMEEWGETKHLDSS